jgi:release factor glutamine methyltransferase
VTVRDALARAATELRDRGVDTPENDAELLLAHVLGLSRAALALERRRRLTEPERATFDALLRRRAKREPLAYVLGEWGFRRLILKTDRRALVPRPETETLVERCLELLAGSPAPEVLDVGTGSGAIALALADERPDLRVTATESSPAALAVARANAARLGLEVEWLEGDLLDPVTGPVDAVVANPPYVRDGERLPPEVAFEPAQALFAGPDGLEVYRRLAPALADVPFVALEVGAGQASEVASMLGATEVIRDLAGIKRVVVRR